MSTLTAPDASLPQYVSIARRMFDSAKYRTESELLTHLRTNLTAIFLEIGDEDLLVPLRHTIIAVPDFETMGTVPLWKIPLHEDWLRCLSIYTEEVGGALMLRFSAHRQEPGSPPRIEWYTFVLEGAVLDAVMKQVPLSGDPDILTDARMGRHILELAKAYKNVHQIISYEAGSADEAFTEGPCEK